MDAPLSYMFTLYRTDVADRLSPILRKTGNLAAEVSPIVVPLVVPIVVLSVAPMGLPVVEPMVDWPNGDWLLVGDCGDVRAEAVMHCANSVVATTMETGKRIFTGPLMALLLNEEKPTDPVKRGRVTVCLSAEGATNAPSAIRLCYRAGIAFGEFGRGHDV